MVKDISSNYEDKIKIIENELSFLKQIYEDNKLLKKEIEEQKKVIDSQHQILNIILSNNFSIKPNGIFSDGSADFNNDEYIFYDVGVSGNNNPNWTSKNFRVEVTDEYTILKQIGDYDGTLEVTLPEGNFEINLDINQVDGAAGSFFFQFSSFNKKNPYLNGNSFYNLKLAIGEWHRYNIKFYREGYIICTTPENYITSIKTFDVNNLTEQIKFMLWSPNDITELHFKNLNIRRL